MAENMRLVLELMCKSGNLRSELNNSSKTVNRFASGVKGALDKIGNRWSAIFTGGAAMASIKKIGDLSQRLTMMGIQAGKTQQEVDGLYQKVLEIANMKDIRVDPAQLLNAIDTIVEKTGDFDLATSGLRNMGLVMRATGAEGKDVGDMVANMKEKFGIKTDAEMLSSLDILIKQGKAGAFTLKDLTTQGNRVTAAYASMGGKGVEGIKQMGAVLQVFRKSTGGPEETSTAFKNLFNDLMEKQKVLKKIGIGIWDPAELKKGHKSLKPLVGLIDEILKKTKGDPDKISKIFGMQTMDGLNAFIAEYQKTGKNAALEFMNVAGDGSELLGDAARAAEEFNAAIQSLNTSWQRFAHSELIGPVRSLTRTLDGLEPGAVQKWLKVSEYIAMTVGSLVALSKVSNLVKPILSLLNNPPLVPAGPGQIASPSAVPASPVVGGAAVIGASLYGILDSISLIMKNFSGEKMSQAEQDRAMLYSQIPEANLFEPPKNEIHMNITVDQNGRATSSSDDPNTKVLVRPKRRGYFYEPDLF